MRYPEAANWRLRTERSIDDGRDEDYTSSHSSPGVASQANAVNLHTLLEEDGHCYGPSPHSGARSGLELDVTNIPDGRKGAAKVRSIIISSIICEVYHELYRVVAKEMRLTFAPP